MNEQFSIIGSGVDDAHCNCVFCGGNNPLSSGLLFRQVNDCSIVAELQGRTFMQGYDGILHGGFISALLEEAMAHVLFNKKIKGFPVNLDVSYFKVVPFNADLTLKARLVDEELMTYKLSAELLYNNEVIANGLSDFTKISLLNI